MAKHGKRYENAAAKIDSATLYDVADGIKLLKEISGGAKFDETVDVAFRLGLDPRHADQQIRGAVVLPHGTGKTSTVLVFAKEGPKFTEATEAGADFVGGEDLVEKIKGGWFGFDVAIATPDMMGVVGRIGKILGPKGLMPNPKVGTVTMDVAKAINEVKAGKVEYRVEKTGIVHVIIGKASFDEEKLLENLKVMIETILKAKPSGAKGQYIKSVALSTTMGPAIRLNPAKMVL